MGYRTTNCRVATKQGHGMGQRLTQKDSTQTPGAVLFMPTR